MNRLFFLLVILVASCTRQKMSLLMYKPYDGGSAYTFKIPSGYKEVRLSGDNEYIQEYHYSDSSMFYITSFRNTVNYEEIRLLGMYNDRFNALNSKDSLTLQGRREDGNFWKDKLFESGITVGYSKVQKTRVAEFDRAILSVKRLN